MRNGKTILQLKSFIDSVEKGKSTLLIGHRYVVMDRDSFDKLCKGAEASGSSKEDQVSNTEWY